MVTEGGETMGDKAETWRVVRETDDGMERTETLNVTATASAAWPWEVVTDDGAASGRTPRDAVVRMARLYMWTVTEILAPGEPTRAELAAEVERLRAENATLRASTDAAVDGVRAMLPEALRIAREEGAAEMRERCAIACSEISRGHNERAKACTKDRDEEWQWGHAGGADECIAAIRALPLAAPTEVTP